MSTTATGPAVQAESIIHAYGERRALDGFTVDVPRRSVFGLLGPNGSGKSTFITMVAAMEQPQTGKLKVLGEVPAAGLRARVGTVFQENAQDPNMRAAEQLLLAGRVFGMAREQARSRAEALLGQFGLGARANDPISALSGGMRRRLEMARALLHDPDLLLLDEPTTGVDPGERQALWAALLDTPDRGRTILLATNDLAEADRVCDAVAFIRDGRVIACGTPAELKRGLRREAVRVGWEGPSAEQLAQAAAWPGAGDITALEGIVHATVDDAAAFVPRLFALAGSAIRSVTIERASLEDAYFQYVNQRAAAPEAVA